jgi:hypothetical protein
MVLVFIGDVGKLLLFLGLLKFFSQIKQRLGAIQINLILKISGQNMIFIPSSA